MGMKAKYYLTDHCCKRCEGRILEQEDGEKFVCADCGREGEKHEDICYCGWGKGTTYVCASTKGMKGLITKCEKEVEPIPSF